MLIARFRWREEGEEPDYRFSLANERTFLAWIRTSLALLAGAVALAQVVPPFAIRGTRTALAVLLALGGLGTAASAHRRWSRNERAMRQRQPLPHSLGMGSLAVAVTGIALAILVLVALSER